MWATEHEEKLTFGVANTKEVGSLVIKLHLCYGAVQDCRVNNIQFRNFALGMPLCRTIYCGLQLIPTQCTHRAPQEDFAWWSWYAVNSHISVQNTHLLHHIIIQQTKIV